MSAHDNHVCNGICAAMEAAPANPTVRLFKLYDLFKVNKDALIKALPTESEVVAFFKDVYDKTIRSINVAYIPDIVEQKIHDVLWGALEQTIRAAYPG
jgi:hypothetical protein